MVKVILERTDGGISVVSPAKKWETEEELLAIVQHAVDKNPDLDGSIVRAVVADDEFYASLAPAPGNEARYWDYRDGNVVLVVPSNKDQQRYYRDAWTWKVGKGLHKDPTKVQEKDLFHMRRARDFALRDSDALVTRCIEDGGDLTALKQYRQRLRDITEPVKAGAKAHTVTFPVKP